MRVPSPTAPAAHHSKSSNRWVSLAWVIPVVVVAAFLCVLLARWIRGFPDVQDFLATYPGSTPLPEWAPEGFPAWIGWQHFLNGFFLVLLVRTGLLLRRRGRPPARWKRDNTRGIRTKGSPWKISIYLWLHLTVDALWVLNGVLFIVLLFATGQWVRIVPTTLEVVPNALSALLQYVSFDWPVEHAWVNYNSVQQLSYFVTVFIAAPLAFVTGIRLSSVWPQHAPRLNRAYPALLAKLLHFPVMIYFVGFVLVHVTLVLATGARANLNAMYAGIDDAASWIGFGIFAISLAVMIAGWFLVRPALLKPVAGLTGTVSR